MAQVTEFKIMWNDGRNWHHVYVTDGDEEAARDIVRGLNKLHGPDDIRAQRRLAIRNDDPSWRDWDIDWV